ncbi:hypothetical protein A3C77_03220 [Candidatus Giovannonibacteria bacterium RIFCSPHIGHO2_02_FULL_45_13]|nr:MAG: hypothetical protein A3C77_03220 [Candidatus Giovannonibacteria bacterium RIFCSPHIGHO2_02_FULL_45_13]
MIMIRIKTITHNIHQLRRRTSKLGFAKRILINTAYWIYRIKLFHALQKTLEVIIISKHNTLICATIINVIKFAVCKYGLSHNS